MGMHARRKLQVLTAAAAVSVLACVPVFAEDQNWEDKAAADVISCANIRSEATIQSGRLGVLPAGAMADVVERGETWTYVASGEVEGYIRNDLLVFGEEARQLYESTHGEDTVTAVSIEDYQGSSASGSVQEEAASAVSGSELDLLAAIIQCEAGGESHEGKVAVDETQVLAQRLQPLVRAAPGHRRVVRRKRAGIIEHPGVTIGAAGDEHGRCRRLA